VMDRNYVGNKFHPTQKPVGLLLKLIKAFCLIGGTTLESFMSSGFTAMACVKSRIFDYLGYELDGNYFNIAIKKA
ncbi:hypothetical protein THERMOT_740, partial [Bathymodiolus thermophilus thioautotrophic gill symbiont]|uniref:DNA methyltransferase n=1 Tax=Bathymodiolus thermophilus thioautotrophic gill symbiont TaxID=2360 RepID=UPI001A183020